ncbi:LIM/homeobox protein Lhx6 [Carassius gibelio]|uniref:LIM/homeobox protein Lhx6 n=1 Tax=Carassius gibelio TaxID=101364 RepID=UPI0022773F9B|nr:LIM/homeobox protein Lhx6 [Carassius gibelio]
MKSSSNHHCRSLRENLGEKRSRSSSRSSLLICARCAKEIVDREMLKVNGLTWHLRCFQCSVCAVSLSQHTSCFIRNTEIFCRTDYNSTFGIKCTRCGLQVSANNWVRRAGNDIYHLACFACFFCKRQLSTGEEFGLMDNQVLCRLHYEILLPNLQHMSDKDGALPIQYLPKPPKRPRTSFTSEQLQIMQTHFTQDKNPDAQTLQRLADMTGLSRRVIQVWFQNCRARQKRNPLHDSVPAQDRYQTFAMPFLSDSQYFLPSGRPETQ